MRLKGGGEFSRQIQRPSDSFGINRGYTVEPIEGRQESYHGEFIEGQQENGHRGYRWRAAEHPSMKWSDAKQESENENTAVQALVDNLEDELVKIQLITARMRSCV